MKSLMIFGALLLLCGTACNRTPQEKAARFLKSGHDYMARKDYARAALQFRNAVKLLPKDAEAEYQLGLAYLSGGDLNQAVAALFRATQLDPKHLGARVKLAEVMARSGDPGIVQEGQARLRALLATTPGNIDALNALALSELQAGELQDAERHLREALQRFPSNLASTVALAGLYLKRQDVKDAEDLLKTARSTAPQSADVQQALGEFYILTGRWSDAESAFQNALRMSPNDVRSLLGFGAVEARLNKRHEAEKVYRRLSDLPDPRYQHLHAAYLFAEGQREAALTEFDKLAKKLPGDRASRSRLVAAYLVTGQVSAAEHVLSESLKRNPTDVDALLQRAQILLRTRKDLEAEKDLNQVIHFRPDSADAHYLLAQVYQLRGDRSRQSTALADAIRYNPELLAARTELAQLLTLSNSPSASLEVLNAAPATQKQTLAWLLERNLADYANGDRAAFRDGVEQALKAARTPDVLLQDAVAKLTERDFAGARASIGEVLKQSPDDLRAIQAEVISYAAQNQKKLAAQFLSQLAAQSKSPAVAEFAGEWLWAAGEREPARTAMVRAKSLDPKYKPAELALAQTDLADGKLDQARMELTQVLTEDPRNSTAHVLFAGLETKAGHAESAIEHYRKALAVEPRNTLVLNNLAYLLADKANQPDAALSYAQQAVEAAPNNADAMGTLGWIFYQKKLYRDAQQLLSRAVAHDGNSKQPNAVVRKYHLAMVYFELGDRTKGQETFLEALQQNPNLPEAQMAQALLR